MGLALKSSHKPLRHIERIKTGLNVEQKRRIEYARG
jgi:hypothetical protein